MQRTKATTQGNRPVPPFSPSVSHSCGKWCPSTASGPLVSVMNVPSVEVCFGVGPAPQPHLLPCSCYGVWAAVGLKSAWPLKAKHCSSGRKPSVSPRRVDVDHDTSASSRQRLILSQPVVGMMHPIHQSTEPHRCVEYKLSLTVSTPAGRGRRFTPACQPRPIAPPRLAPPPSKAFLFIFIFCLFVYM